MSRKAFHFYKATIAKRCINGKKVYLSTLLINMNSLLAREVWSCCRAKPTYGSVPCMAPGEMHARRPPSSSLHTQTGGVISGIERSLSISISVKERMKLSEEAGERAGLREVKGSGGQTHYPYVWATRKDAAIWEEFSLKSWGRRSPHKNGEDLSGTFGYCISTWLAPWS